MCEVTLKSMDGESLGIAWTWMPLPWGLGLPGARMISSGAHSRNDKSRQTFQP